MQNTLVWIPIVFWDDRPWSSRSNLTWKSNFAPFWACSHHYSSAIQARITKFGPKMHLNTVKIPTNFGLDWFWSSLSFSILKPIFLPNLFAPFCVYLVRPVACKYYWDHRWRPIESVWLLTEHTICRKSSRSISIDNHFCNRFINLGRPIFSLNHSGASAATVFTIPDNIRDHACAVLHSRWAGHPICGPSWIIAIWFSHCSVNPLRPQNCIYLQSDLSCF